MKKPLIIWFDDKGNLLDRSYKWNHSSNKSEEARDFSERLEFVKFDSYGAGRADFKSISTGRHFGMFFDDFEDVIKNHLFNDNVIEGTFKFVKKGVAQGIKLIIQKAP